MAVTKDIVNYIMETPQNTNPRILRTMVENLKGESGTGTGEGIKVVDSLPKNAKAGDVCYVANNYKGEPRPFEDFLMEALEKARLRYVHDYGDADNLVEFAYKWYARREDKQWDELTSEEQAEALRDIVQGIFDDDENAFTIAKFKGATPPTIQETLSSLAEDDVYQNGNGLYYKRLEDVVFYAGLEGQKDDDFQHVDIKLIPCTSQNIGTNENDWPRLYIPTNNEYVYSVDSALKCENGEDKIIPVVHMGLYGGS